MTGISLLYPEIGLACFGLLLMLADLWIPPRHGKVLFHLALFSAAVGLGMLGLAYSDPRVYQGVGALWVVDPLSLFFKVLVLSTVIGLSVLSYRSLTPIWEYCANPVRQDMPSSGDRLALIFLSLGWFISSFLVGFERREARSIEEP